jgi:transposase
MRFMGCTIILTNETELDGETVLDAYRSRDSVEKLFDTMKNENGQHRLRTGDNLIAEGQVFLSMLSLILRKGLESRMRMSGLLKKYSVDALIAEIEKISVIKLTYGDDILMEITKKQRDIFAKLGISLPQIT